MMDFVDRWQASDVSKLYQNKPKELQRQQNQETKLKTNKKLSRGQHTTLIGIRELQCGAGTEQRKPGSIYTERANYKGQVWSLDNRIKVFRERRKQDRDPRNRLIRMNKNTSHKTNRNPTLT